MSNKKDNKAERGIGQTILADFLCICGTGFVALGLWLIYEPAAYIWIGAIMLTAGITAWRSNTT